MIKYERGVQKISDLANNTVFTEEVIEPIYNSCYQDAEFFTETI